MTAEKQVALCESRIENIEHKACAWAHHDLKDWFFWYIFLPKYGLRERRDLLWLRLGTTDLEGSTSELVRIVSHVKRSSIPLSFLSSSLPLVDRSPRQVPASSTGSHDNHTTAAPGARKKNNAHACLVMKIQAKSL